MYSISSVVLLFDHIQLVTHLAKHCLTAKRGCIQHWYENQSNISFSLTLFHCCPKHCGCHGMPQWMQTLCVVKLPYWIFQ